VERRPLTGPPVRHIAAEIITAHSSKHLRNKTRLTSIGGEPASLPQLQLLVGRVRAHSSGRSRTRSMQLEVLTYDPFMTRGLEWTWRRNFKNTRLIAN
jgi:hypothetical protein